MKRGWAFLLLAACSGTTHQDVSVVHVHADVRCESDAGACEGLSSSLRDPHCGWDVASLDAGTFTIETASGPDFVQNALVVETSQVDAGPLPDRRQVLVGSATVRPAFGFGPVLYTIDTTGQMVADPDAGPVDVQGSALTFHYDDGAAHVSETHALLGIDVRSAEVHDHSGDPFYSCCSEVGVATPGCIALALLLLRRRR